MHIKIHDLSGFVAAVESAYSDWDCFDRTTGLWFRGQSQASWKLVPGLYRQPIGVRPEYERELARDFRLRSGAYLERPPLNGLEWLFIMQHYGMPTRLLDWTEGHLFALYFAVWDRNYSEDAAVWILDPWSLNGNVIELYSVPLAEHPALRDYAIDSGDDNLGRNIKATHPAAVRPPSATPRIIAQKGTFTVHGSLREGLDMIAGRTKRKTRDEKIRVRQLVIDGSQKKKILKQLYWAGVTEAVLFPDLVGLCGDISYRYSDEHLLCKCP